MQSESKRAPASEHEVQITTAAIRLDGTLTLPSDPRGVVIFAHGSGSSRFSPRNRYVAGVLHQSGIATLLMDLLTRSEERVDAYTAHLRFDISLLAQRLLVATDWLKEETETAALPVGYFGASTGAGAALVAAAERDDIAAVVSRGGRPDLAGVVLARVKAPTLLIVGGDDVPVIEMNREAMEQMRCPTRLEIIPGAGHLFEEPGKLEEVARLARAWFETHLTHMNEQAPAA
jgi:putative phosphoribosyl transferase